MPINYGSNKISNIKFGATNIQKVCLGTDVVWSGNTPIILDYDLILSGYPVTNFDQYPWQIVDSNFFFTEFSTVNIDETFAVTSGTRYLKMECGFLKEYDSTDGFLKMNAYNDLAVSTVPPLPDIKPGGSRTNTVVFVPNTTELELLTDGAYDPVGDFVSYNINSLYPDEYENFTEDNFLFSHSTEVIESTDTELSTGSYKVLGEFTLNKSYDSHHGILRVYVTVRGSITKLTSTVLKSWKFNVNPQVWLTKVRPM